jgi:Tfp pilus assembly protein PilF
LLSKFDIRFTNDWQLYLQGFFLAADNDLVSYEKQFLAMIERFSDKKQDVFLEISVFFQRKNRYIDSENLLTHYYTVFSQDFRYPFLLGLNYLYQDNDTKALENMYEAIAIDSNSADVWVNIGIIYDRLNDVDSAEFAYKRALSINNMHALANNNYAYSLASAGKELRKALEMVQTALQSEPNNSAYLDTYGWVLFKLGKKELAIEQILKSIEIGGAGPEVYEHLGDIYKEIGKMDDAIRAYKDGLSNYPNNDLLKTKLEEISK